MFTESYFDIRLKLFFLGGNVGRFENYLRRMYGNFLVVAYKNKLQDL